MNCSYVTKKFLCHVLQSKPSVIPLLHLNTVNVAPYNIGNSFKQKSNNKESQNSNHKLYPTRIKISRTKCLLNNWESIRSDADSKLICVHYNHASQHLIPKSSWCKHFMQNVHIRPQRRSIFSGSVPISNGDNGTVLGTNRLDCNNLLRNPKSISFVISSRTLFQENRPLPKLVYLPNYFSWLKHKMEFWMLKQWDPDFTEGSFRFGTMQAISRITQILQTGTYEELAGLLTKSARIMLIHEAETRWTDVQRRFIGLKPENIQLIIPRRLNFRRVLGKKICEVDLVFIALKWAEHRSRRAMVFIEVFARFRRDFGAGVIPEWTISIFRIHRFEIIHR